MRGKRRNPQMSVTTVIAVAAVGYVAYKALTSRPTTTVYATDQWGVPIPRGVDRRPIWQRLGLPG